MSSDRVVGSLMEGLSPSTFFDSSSESKVVLSRNGKVKKFVIGSLVKIIQDESVQKKLKKKRKIENTLGAGIEPEEFQELFFELVKAYHDRDCSRVKELPLLQKYNKKKGEFRKYSLQWMVMKYIKHLGLYAYVPPISMGSTLIDSAAQSSMIEIDQFIECEAIDDNLDIFWSSSALNPNSAKRPLSPAYDELLGCDAKVWLKDAIDQGAIQLFGYSDAREIIWKVTPNHLSSEDNELKGTTIDALINALAIKCPDIAAYLPEGMRLAIGQDVQMALKFTDAEQRTRPQAVLEHLEASLPATIYWEHELKVVVETILQKYHQHRDSRKRRAPW